jgi:hypothetical protein
MQDKLTESDLDALIRSNRELYEAHADEIARQMLAERVVSRVCTAGLVLLVLAIATGVL